MPAKRIVISVAKSNLECSKPKHKGSKGQESNLYPFTLAKLNMKTGDPPVGGHIR